MYASCRICDKNLNKRITFDECNISFEKFFVFNYILFFIFFHKKKLTQKKFLLLKNSVPQLISWLQQRGDFSDDLSGHRDGMSTPGIDLLELCLKTKCSKLQKSCCHRNESWVPNLK